MNLIEGIIKSAVNTAKYTVQSEVNSEIRKAVHSAADKLRDTISNKEDNDKKAAAAEADVPSYNSQAAESDDDDYGYSEYHRDGDTFESDFERRFKGQNLDQTVTNLQDGYSELSESGKGESLSETDKINAMLNYAAKYTSGASKGMEALAGSMGDVLHDMSQKTDNPTLKRIYEQKEMIARKRQTNARKVAQMHDEYVENETNI